MEAMRLASEQQLSPDCLTGIGSSDRLDGRNSPSLESLATLLWATQVFEKNSSIEQVGNRQENRGGLELFGQEEEISRGVSLVSGCNSGAKKVSGGVAFGGSTVNLAIIGF